MQSMVVADTTGAIGMIAPGRVPVRDARTRVGGRAPVPGWDAIYDWQGYLRFEDLPKVLNPQGGAIGTANARIPGYPRHLTFDWEADFRQRRVDELIAGRPRHDVASMRAAQADVLSPAAVRLRPLMVAAARAGGGADELALIQLARWDATMRADRAEPLIFTAWVREAMKAVYGDDLGAAFGRYFDMRATALIRLLEGRATGRDWCDDRGTTAHETCAGVLAAALNAAVADLAARYGADRGAWRWGAAHVAYGEHRPFGALRLVGAFFNVEVPSPGGSHTLNRGKTEFAEDPPFVNRHASSYRAIYDLADLDRSLFIHTTGQSGNPFSPAYRAFAERWSKGEYIEIPTRREAIDRNAQGTWGLSPR
jgi:penicillin amidase